MLRILRDVREGNGQPKERLTSEQLRSRRGQIWKEVDEKQPSLEFSATRCGIESQRDRFRMIRFPQWLNDSKEDNLNGEERKRVARLVEQAKRGEKSAIQNSCRTGDPSSTERIWSIVKLQATASFRQI